MIDNEGHAIEAIRNGVDSEILIIYDAHNPDAWLQSNYTVKDSAINVQ